MKKILLLLFLICTGIVAVIGKYAYQGYQEALTAPLKNLENNRVYTLERGTSIKRLAADLEQRGMINKALYLELYARQNKLGTTIKAGEYELDDGLTLQSLMALFSTGSSLQYKFTIIEGTRYGEILSNLSTTEHLKATLNNDQFITEFQQMSGQPHPEGWLLPDTYYYTRHETDMDLVKRSWKAMQKYLDSAWASRDDNLPLKSAYEALILASIVEKETGVPGERPTIAGVFINRLNKGMKLQTDPTVIYGMGDQYKGNIRKKDLKTDTPWNTYTRKGLPPTPIATASKASIDAVMHPAKTSALFFVAKGGGEHYFSDTYKEHRKAVIKYQLKGKASRYTGDS